MLLTPFGIVMLVKDLQPEKASSPILLTLSGIVTLVKEEQPAKTTSPMLLTPSGIVILVKEEQPTKAPALILVTLSGIVIFVNPPGTATSVFPFFVNKSPKVDLKEGLLKSTEKEVRLEQPAKAPSPMLLTLFGIVMHVKDSQPLKATLPILVTLFGIVILFNEEQSSKAATPMLLTLSGIVMPIKEVQPEKAFSPMLVTGISPNFDGIVSRPNGSVQSFVIVASPLTTINSQVWPPIVLVMPSELIGRKSTARARVARSHFFIVLPVGFELSREGHMGATHGECT